MGADVAGMRSMPGRWVGALFSHGSPFIDILSIRIPSARSNWNSSVRCSLHEESRSDATLACSSRAANPVNEVFGYLRKVIVDDVGDILHVNAAGSHIRRDQHAVLPSLKSG